MTKQNLFLEIEYHLLNDEEPSKYLNSLLSNPLIKDTPYNMLLKLKNTNQSPVHHPEGNVWKHTMLVIDEAVKVKSYSTDVKAFMWAALLHDLGKAQTTKIRKNKITSYNHDTVGAKLANEFLSVFSNDKVFINKVSQLVKFHMHILFVNKNLPFANIKDMLNSTNPSEVALLGYCDRMGRGKADKKDVEANILDFIENVKKFGGDING